MISTLIYYFFLIDFRLKLDNFTLGIHADIHINFNILITTDRNKLF